MADYRVKIEVGERVLLPTGYGLVTAVHRDGYSIRNPIGETVETPWTDLVPVIDPTSSENRATQIALRPLMDTLDTEALTEAINWTEVVQTIVTGFQNGHAALALDGEPFYPYGPAHGVSLDKRCERMAIELSRERELNRDRSRRVQKGELKNASISKSTVRSKVTAWETMGFAGLIDGRKIRRTDKFERIDETFRRTIEDIVQTIDGDRSTISHREILRQARVSMKKRGIDQYEAPQRAVSGVRLLAHEQPGPHDTRATQQQAPRIVGQDQLLGTPPRPGRCYRRDPLRRTRLGSHPRTRVLRGDPHGHRRRDPRRSRSESRPQERRRRRRRPAALRRHTAVLAGCFGDNDLQLALGRSPGNP